MNKKGPQKATGRVISAYALALILILWFIVCMLIALWGSGA